MAIRYIVSYIQDNTSGFSFFGFRRKRKPKCNKCNYDYAVMTVTNKDNLENKIDVCVLCYNDFSAEQLLGEESPEQQIRV